MANVEQMVKEMCPEGVERKNVAELCDISRGCIITQEYIRSHPGPYPVYSSSTRNNGSIGGISTYDYDGEYVTWTTDGYAGTVFYRNEKFNATNICGLLKVKDGNVINAKYLAFVLKETAKAYSRTIQRNAKLMCEMMAKIPVPVPPMEIQVEIARQLDAMEGLVKTLKEEKKLREKQLGYYRNMLTDFSEEGLNKRTDKVAAQIHETHKESLVRKPLKEICEIGTGSSNLNEAVEGGLYPFYVRSHDIKTKDAYEFDEEAVIIPGDGKIGEIFHHIDGKYALHQRAYRIHPTTNSIDTKYLYHYMQAYFPQYIQRIVLVGTVPSIRKPMIEDFEIIIPPLEIQREIASTLDTLEDYCRKALPAEIAARQKQYAYYRNRLLTFPPMQAAA